MQNSGLIFVGIGRCDINVSKTIMITIAVSESGAAICTFYMKSICHKGAACPFRHVKGDRTIVCKHWLRGLCKKGDDCEFLHEYDMSKMPECYFFSKFGEYTLLKGIVVNFAYV